MIKARRLVLPLFEYPNQIKMLGRRERCLADVEGGRKKSKIDPTVTMEKDSPDEKECSTLMSLPVSAS